MTSITITPVTAADETALPTVTPQGSYRLLRRHGDLIFISGQGPLKADGTFHTGKVGSDVDTAEAYQHARLVGRLMLATLEDEGMMADSSGRRNTDCLSSWQQLVKCLCRRFPAQALSRSSIEGCCHGGDFVGAVEA